MTSTDDSDHGRPGPEPRGSPRHFASPPSPFNGSGADSPPRYIPPRREHFHNDRAHTDSTHASASARHATSEEGLYARRRAVLHRIQAEADAAVAELEERQSFCRIQRHQRRMSSRPEAVDANYVKWEEAMEKEEDIEELCDILLEEYGVEVEPLPPGARAPIYGPKVRAAWPVADEGEGPERNRRSRMSRESRHVLESSENETSEAEDEELVKSMRRGQSDRLRAQTSLRGTYHGYDRPSGGDWRRRRSPYDDGDYGTTSRPRPRPRGPGPAPPTGAEGDLPIREEEVRERKRLWEREQEMMRQREIQIEREMKRERDLRREQFEKEMSERQRAENEEEWEDMQRHTFVRTRPIIITRHSPNPAPNHRYDDPRRPRSDYDLRRTESYGDSPAAANPAYEAGYRPGVDRLRRRWSEYPGSAPQPMERRRSDSQDAYMHGGLHADDAPPRVSREEESEDGGVRRRSSGHGKYRDVY